MKQKQITKLIWQDIPIVVSFICEWPLNDFCHIEVRADEPLPITETGYKSHFMPMEHLSGYEDHIAYVNAWLDHTGKSKQWHQHIQQSRQGDLFDL